MAEREKWAGKGDFVLAAIGSAVGLGNAWRFPGLCAKNGGGAFLIAYLICLITLGIPILMMETAIGRKAKGSAPKALASLNRKAEPIGWASTANSFIIMIYYAVVFGWCILMTFLSFRFATTHSTPETASTLWQEEIGATFQTSLLGNGHNISLSLLICVGIAWILIYACIRKGIKRVGKVVQFTVFVPVIMLLILAIRGFIGNPHIGEAMNKLFVPDLASFGNIELWVAAMGQSFFSLSILSGVLFAYGSFLRKESNVVTDSLIIAFSDLGISILSGIVLFSTMYATGMSVDNMSSSGVATAFIIYPTAIVGLSPVPALNAGFGFVFYFMLCTLAIDSAFSMLEAIVTSITDKFAIEKKKVLISVTLIAVLFSVFLTTGAGVAYIDIIDYWCGQNILLVIGVAEAIAVGWFFKPKKVLDEINKNTKKVKMPGWAFYASVRFLAPLSLAFLFIWQIYLLIQNGMRFNPTYDLAAEIILGWVLAALILASGFIISLLSKSVLSNQTIKLEDGLNCWDESEEKPELVSQTNSDRINE